MDWKDEEGPTVDELAQRLRQYEESLASSLILAVERLPDILAEKRSQEFQRFADKFGRPPVRTNTSALRRRYSSGQERGERRYIPRDTLWFYLLDYREDMKKWDGKPTSVLDVRVRELRGKTIRCEGSSRKNAASVPGGQCEWCGRQSGRAGLPPDPMRRNSNPFLQKVSGESYG